MDEQADGKGGKTAAWELELNDPYELPGKEASTKIHACKQQWSNKQAYHCGSFRGIFWKTAFNISPISSENETHYCRANLATIHSDNTWLPASIAPLIYYSKLQISFTDQTIRTIRKNIFSIFWSGSWVNYSKYFYFLYKDHELSRGVLPLLIES